MKGVRVDAWAQADDDDDDDGGGGCGEKFTEQTLNYMCVLMCIHSHFNDKQLDTHRHTAPLFIYQ